MHTLKWVHDELEGPDAGTAWLDQVVITPVFFHLITFDLGSLGTRVGGGELVQSVRAGTAALAPTVSTEAGWALSGWDVAFDAVSAAMTVRAQYVVPTQPVISVFPSPLSVVAGSSAALEVVATGNAPLGYQWYRGETGDTSAPITGATGPLLVTPALNASTRFWVRVANAGVVADTPAVLVTVTPRIARTLRGFGSTAFGRLGNGYPGFAAAPVPVGADVSSVSAGDGHTLFVKTDDSLWGMGSNHRGRLGSGASLSTVPVPIATGVASVATGFSHTLFIKSDGSLWGMGENRFGELGDGSTTPRETPVPIATDVVAISAGRWRSSFIKADGSLWTMGYYPYQGTDDRLSTPVQIATDVSAVAGCYIIKTGGSLWEQNSYESGSAFPAFTQIATNVASVSAGEYHVLFVKTDDSLWVMGENYSGQLGDGTTTRRSSPVQISNSVVAVAAGQDYSLFLKTDHSLWAMGANETGQLGDGTATERHVPVLIATGVSRVSAGRDHSLFIKTDGTLHATGANNAGQLGDGRSVQVSPVTIATGVTSVSAGFTQALFVKIDGTLWETGALDPYWFLAGSTLARGTPRQIATGVASVDSGIEFFRILKTDSSLWESRNNVDNDGRVGPPALSLVATGVSSVAPGPAWHTLFLRPDTSLWGIGPNYEGELGDGTFISRPTPVQITTGVALAAVGFRHSAFVKTDGSLWVMGANYRGQLGDGTTLQRLTPVRIAQGVVAIATAYDQTYFLKHDGTLWSTGDKIGGPYFGVLLPADLVPRQVATGVAHMEVGSSHMFFRTRDGLLWAMGNNSVGELGDGTFISRATPVPIDSSFVAAYPGSGFSMVLTPSRYFEWAARVGLTGADAASASNPQDDPDADGTPNLLEYAFGTSPLSTNRADQAPWVAVGDSAGEPTLVLTHRRRRDTGLSYVYQRSPDLERWTPVLVTPVVINPDVDSNGLVELVSVTVPLGTDPRVFLRLVVSEP
ncbi:MAG: hypothetical protein EAZ36_00230 [Verrucomicrobia bacterium]|nr:MAG: hypothetical protein EAZ36_00230 [Verrucomicrobiota bacterium]